ncbi:MAG: DsbA family protein [Alphaproteobacteria bacterium]|jgi:protein-disulfide isomerase
MTITRRTLIGASTAMLAGAPALAQESWYPLTSADGREIVNFRVPVELETELSELDNVFSSGSERADVTLIEIFDSNCPWCRRAAADMRALALADIDLRITYVNAPALGLGSFQAAKVEYAVKKVAGAQKCLSFHHAFMSLRGPLDGVRALGIAKDMGLNAAEIEEIADDPATGAVIRDAARLARALNLAATPSWLIAGTAIIGYPGRPALEAIVRDVRQCDKPVCG